MIQQTWCFSYPKKKNRFRHQPTSFSAFKYDICWSGLNGFFSDAFFTFQIKKNLFDLLVTIMHIQFFVFNYYVSLKKKNLLLITSIAFSLEPFTQLIITFIVSCVFGGKQKYTRMCELLEKIIAHVSIQNLIYQQHVIVLLRYILPPWNQWFWTE